MSAPTDASNLTLRRPSARANGRGATRREGITSVGAVVLAFLASQHHNLHMLLFAVGIGGAGMSFMTMDPLVRRVMLFSSLVIVGVALYQVRYPKRLIFMRIMGGVSILLTLGLLIWSVLRFRRLGR